MKKIIASLFIFTLSIFPSQGIFAAENSVSFFESLGNISKLENYKDTESLQGSVEIKEGEDHVTLEYGMSAKSMVDTKNQLDSNQITLRLKFKNHGQTTDSVPFKEGAFQISGDVISKGTSDLYFRLNNFNLDSKGSLPSTVENIKGTKIIANLYKGKWFHVPVSALAGNQKMNNKELQAFQTAFQQHPEMGVIGLTQLILANNKDLSEEQKTAIIKGVELLTKTQIFTDRKILTGKNKDFHFFNLSKAAIMDFFTKLGNLVGQDMSATDMSDLRSGLSKVNLSGLYKINDAYSLIDQFMMKLKLKDLGSVKNMELNLSYKLSDLNKKTEIKLPASYQEFSNPFGSTGLSQ